MDITLPPDFKEFLRLLNAHGVEYLLIGGYAVGYHGYPRATGDIDIWIELNPDNAARTVAVLREFGFDSPQLSEAAARRISTTCSIFPNARQPVVPEEQT